MRFSRVEYVMASHDTREHYIVSVYEGDREAIHTLRLFTGDYDYVPGFSGALESAYEVAELLAGDDGRVYADDVSVADILAGLV